MSMGEDGLVNSDTGGAAAAQGQLMSGCDLEGGARMQLRSAAAAGAGVGDVEGVVVGGGQQQRKAPSMLEMLLGAGSGVE
jgi:hypothetical protein